MYYSINEVERITYTFEDIKMWLHYTADYMRMKKKISLLGCETVTVLEDTTREYLCNHGMIYFTARSKP